MRERAIQSLEYVLYRYVEDHGEKFVPKLLQLVSTLNCRKNHRDIGKSPRNVKHIDILSILYYIKFTKPNFKFGDRVIILKKDIQLRKVYKPPFTDEIFEDSALFTKKPPVYIIKDLEKEVILENFYEKELRKRSDLGKVIF